MDAMAFAGRAWGVRSGRMLAGATLALTASTLVACNGEAPSADREVQTPTPSSIAGSAAPTLDEVVENVEKTLTVYNGVATGAIVLVRVGERTRVLTLGMADVERRQRMKPGGRFPIQSISKTMVATVVLQLVDDGELELDDTVEEVLPGRLPQGDRITIRHLLSHRAGLHDATDKDVPTLALTTQDTFIDIAADHPLEFAPGSSGLYSNVGYEVLGRAVEQVTGQALADALEQRVFGPAGMSQSALLGPQSVTGYYESEVADDPYLQYFSAAGGVVSTVRDIDRFYTALWGGELLDPELVKAMSEPSGVVSPFGADYGLGVWFNRESCGTAMGHSGGGPGFNTKAWTLPDAGRAVVVMVNDGDGTTIADQLASAALCP